MYEKGQLKAKKRGDPRWLAVGYYTIGCLRGKAAETANSETRLACSLAGTMTLTLALEEKKHKRQKKLIASAVGLLETGCQMGDDGSCKALVKIEQIVNE